MADIELSTETPYQGVVPRREDGTVIDPAADGLPVASAGSITTVAASASAVSLLAANTDRKSARIVNDSTAVLYVALGETASATNYTAKLAADEAFNFDGYTGAVSGIWASATGNARITELS